MRWMDVLCPWGVTVGDELSRTVADMGSELGIAVLDDSQCDLNHDGIVDVADVTTLVNIITAAK